MGNAYKVGDKIIIYFGDTMRDYLRKTYRKKNVYFIEYRIAAIYEDRIVVFPEIRDRSKQLPYDISGICIAKTDRHILPTDDLSSILSKADKEVVASYAEQHGFKKTEFKEALKPYRKSAKD